MTFGGLSRGLAALLALVAIGLTVMRLAGVTAEALTYGVDPRLLYYLLISAASVMAAAISIAVVRSAWNADGTGYLAFALASLALASAYEGVVPAILAQLPLPGSAAVRVDGILLSGLVTFATASGLRWLQTFPIAIERHDLRLWSDFSGRRVHWVCRWLEWCLRPAVVWLGFGLLPFLAMTSALWGAPVEPVTIWLVFLFLATATGALYQMALRSTASTPQHTKKAGWTIEALLVLGVLVAFAAIVEVQVHALDRSGAIIRWSHSILFPLAFIAFLISAGISVFYRGAVDPSLVVHRTTVLGAVGVTLTLLFLVGEEVLSKLVETWFGLPPIIGGVMAGLLAAAVFGPLYGWAKKLSREPGSDSTT